MLMNYFATSCSPKIKLSLFFLLVGVGIASITDLQLNFVGTILSLLAIITTCVGQIVSFTIISLCLASVWIDLFDFIWLRFLTYWTIQLTNTIQKKLNVTSTQLLYQSAPFQAAILFVSGPFVDQMLTKQNVFAYKYSPIVLVSNIKSQPASEFDIARLDTIIRVRTLLSVWVFSNY